MIPGARRRQDWARYAFAAVEEQLLREVNAAVPPPVAQKMIEAAYSARPGGDTTHLEWLKTPSKRHGPSTLAESIEKVRYLKRLGAHEWNLSAVSLAKQQAYARQVQARRPVKTREVKPTRQLIELVCFLRVTLLELTDVALLQSSRRSQQLFREAADKAQSNRVRGTTSLIQQAAKARSVLHDVSKTWQARVLEARELLAGLGEAASGSFVSLVRKALAEDSQRLHASLAALKDPDFGGRVGDPDFEQWKTWTDLRAIHLAPQGPQSFCEQRQAYRWQGLPREVERLRGLVCQRRSVRGVSGAAAVAKWFRLPCVRCGRGPRSYVARTTELPRLPIPMQRHRRNDLRQDTHTASRLVRRRLVHHQPEARHQRPRIAARPGADQLRDRVGDAAPIQARHGSAGS